MKNPNTKAPAVLVDTISVRLGRPLFQKLVEGCRRENVTLSHLVHRMILENESGWSSGR